MSLGEIRLTPSQQQAVDSLDVDCIVSAGAGSGKTRVLVERFLHILDREGDEPDILERIVAITFTEKAATEMKNRIRDGMKRRLEQAQKQGDPVEEQRWYRLLTEAERSRITTIHSFCARLLRDHPVEADVDPGFSIMDEATARTLLRETVEKALPQVVGAGETDEGAALQRWITGWGTEGCLPWVAHLYTQMAGNGWEPEELSRRTRAHQEQVAEQLRREWQVKLDRLPGLAQPLLQLSGGKRVKAFQSAWPELEQELTAARDPEALLPPLRAIKELLKGNWGRKEEITGPRDQMKEQVDRLLQVTTSLLLLPEERQLTEGLLSLLTLVHHRLTRTKGERNAVDFDELQTRAVRLLRDHPEVLQQVRQSIRYLMVDEFQDTNDAQKQLIDCLCSGEEEPGKLFVVGDAKQSIYRFRGAEVSLFSQTREEILSRGGQEVALVDNFRSDPFLVDFVNGLFQRLMSSDPTSPNHYRETVAQKERLGEARVEFLPVPKKEALPEGQDPRDVEAERIACRIEELLKAGTPPGEIVLLFQAMTHVKRYEQALLRRRIPFHVVRGRGFFDRQEVIDVLHYLRWLVDPGDTLSLVGLLRSPFCGISDETLLMMTQEPGWEKAPERWLELAGLTVGEWSKLEGFIRQQAWARRQLGRVSVAQLVEGLLEDSGYLQVLWATPQGKQARANLDKLIHRIREEQGELSYSLDAFLRRVDEWQRVQQETEAAVEPAEGNSVKLMTIHQSKGLEFPVVILPDLSRSPTPHNADVEVDREAGLVVRLRGMTPIQGEPIRWLEWKEREKEQEREEFVRLFYVAVTRAKYRLLLSGVPLEHKGVKKGEGLLSAATWSEWLDGVFSFDRIDDEQGVWELEDPELTIQVRLPAGEAAAVMPEEPSLLDTGGWEPPSDPLLSEKPLTPPAVAVMEPRGWLPLDRMEISVSDLMLLKNCPRKYYYARVAGLSFPLTEEGDPKSPANSEGFTLSPQQRGEIVHRLIETCPAPWEKTSIEWGRILDNFGVPRSSQLQVKKQVQPLFETYLNSRHHLTLSRQSGVKREARWLQVLSGLEVEGIIDRMHRNPDGTWELVDYKTNEVEPGQVEKTAEEYLPQLQLYVLAAKETWGIAVDRATLFFLSPGVEKTWEVDDAWIHRALGDLEESARMLHQGEGIDDYPPRPGYRCGYCEYRKICSAADPS